MKLERLKQNTGLPSAGAVNSEACGVDEGALKSQLTQNASPHTLIIAPAQVASVLNRF